MAGVGVPAEVYTVEATAKLPLTGWIVRGNGPIVWTLSGPGAINANGVYIAPATVATGDKAVITASAGDANPATITLHLIPSGPIRIDVGSSQPYKDSAGNVWSADPFTQRSGAFSQQSGFSGFTGTADPALYSTFIYTWGDDIEYGPYVIAPGTYKVTYYLGNGMCNPGVWDNGLVWGPVMLEVNGQDTLYTPGACKAADSVTRTVTTDTGLVTLGVRALGGWNTHSVPYLNAFSITAGN
jgi:hypothetical protein